MGSEYILKKAEENGCEFSIGEMSNRLAFTMYDSGTGGVLSTVEMSPEQMLKVLVEGMRVVSYWMEIDEFKLKLKQSIQELIS